MIKEVEEGRLTPLLVRAMLNHQSLSEISMYAVPVLNTCFDLYVYKEETHVVFRVNTRNRIKGRDFSTFSYYITEMFATINDDNDVSITMNLNSPGDYVVAFQKPWSLFSKTGLPSCLFILFFSAETMKRWR